MRTALVTASVLGLILMAGISASSDQASAQSRGHADFQGYWMGVDPVDGGDARRSLILRSDGKYALAARAAWDRVERALPGDADDDGR